MFLRSEGPWLKAYSIRQLKKNPSQALREALREARGQPVVVMNHHQPEALLVHLGDDSLLEDVGVRLALATSLYRDGSLSLGKGARFANLSVADLMQHLSRLGIPVIRGSGVEVRSDAATIETWRSGSS